MFNLMDRVPDGITPMLHDLEAHVINQGLADMIAAADIITSVSYINPLLSHKKIKLEKNVLRY
jgi:cullin-5